MGKVSNDAIKKFTNRMNACMKRIGGGRIAMDTGAIKALVRKERETAVRMVEIYCHMAQSNHAYFQGALMIATAYYVEFDDRSLMQMVHKKVKAAGAEDLLKRVSFLKEMPTPNQESPERTAAKEWWRKTGRQQGLCDECGKPMLRGEGYLVRGPVLEFETPSGSKLIDVGEEIICQNCFQKTKGGQI